MSKFFKLLLMIAVVMSSALAYAKDIYYCPMHPFYTSDKPGNCPICNMRLVKKEEHLSVDHTLAEHAQDVDEPLSDHATVYLTTEQMQMMGVKTLPVKTEALIKTVRASGYVSTNEELYKVQDDFIRAYTDFDLAFRDARRISRTRRTWETHRDLQLKLYAAQDKLLRLGLSREQIDALQKFSWRNPWEQPELQSFKQGLNHYWVTAQIFEQDLGFVEVGQEADVDIPSYHEHAKGVVRTIGGELDPQTRTANALVELKDYHGELPLNMLVDVTIKVELNPMLMVPPEAVMDTGLQKIVYVQVKPGVFEPHSVHVIAQGDNGWAVGSGLKENQEVAVEGNFLLDSESRLQGGLQEAGHD